MGSSPPSKDPHPPRKPEKQAQEEEEGAGAGCARAQQRQRKHLCDFCNESIPLLFCRADSARLCFACDRRVHSDNSLFSKHQRSHLCDACDSNPAAILCFTHNLFLCQNCDWDAHDRLSPAHDRRPLEGFSGCPTALEFASALGFDEKGLLVGEDAGDWAVDAVLDGWVWETTAPVLSLDDLIVPTTTAVDASCHGLQAIEFLPPSKHRNVICGRYKEEILLQLRDLAKTETHLDVDSGKLDMVYGMQSLFPDQNIQPQNISTEYENDAVPILVPSCEESAIPWQDNSYEASNQVPFSYKHFLESTIEESSLVFEGCTDVNGSGSHTNGDKKETQPFSEVPQLRPGVYGLTGHDRDTVISRYKEKKKTRRYDKHIRYESRKARADSRTRIRGRFAKVTQDQKN